MLKAVNTNFCWSRALFFFVRGSLISKRKHDYRLDSVVFQCKNLKKWLCLPRCLEKPRVNFPLQKCFSFAKILSNDPLQNSQFDQKPSLGCGWSLHRINIAIIDFIMQILTVLHIYGNFRVTIAYFQIDLKVAKWLIWKHFCEGKTFLRKDVKPWLFLATLANVIMIYLTLPYMWIFFSIYHLNAY